MRQALWGINWKLKTYIMCLTYEMEDLWRKYWPSPPYLQIDWLWKNTENMTIFKLVISRKVRNFLNVCLIPTYSVSTLFSNVSVPISNNISKLHTYVQCNLCGYPLLNSDRFLKYTITRLVSIICLSNTSLTQTR